MKGNGWIAWLLVGGLVLGGCGQTLPPTPTDEDSGEVVEPPTCPPEGRCRGWLLFYVANPSAAAASLGGMLSEGGGSFVVVRTEVVDGVYNLVVPVDTASQTEFDDLVTTLTAKVEAVPLVLIVHEHHPEKTTSANSFVTEFEQEGFETDFPEAGRQVPNSPGANPWG